MKLAPGSCKGCAGGNLLPISGSYNVDDFFFEANLPLIEDVPLAESLIVGFAYRKADYNIPGSNDTWNVTLNWHPIDDRLREPCISIGMTDARLGAVRNSISRQVNVFNGANASALPTPEGADTFTAGFVWTSEFGSTPPHLNVDYYDIEITDVISKFSVQKILDCCY